MLFHCWVHAVACTARRWRIELRRVLQVGDESKVELLDETLGAFLVKFARAKEILVFSCAAESMAMQKKAAKSSNLQVACSCWGLGGDLEPLPGWVAV